MDPELSAPNGYLTGQQLEVSHLTSGSVQKAEVKYALSRRAVGPGSSCRVALPLSFRDRPEWRDLQS